jgi:hypothetical protein
MYEIPIGTPALPSVRVYRSSALSTGSAGSFATISWDQETESGIAHSAGVFTIPRTGEYEWEGGITLGTSSGSEFRVLVQVDAGGGYADVERCSVPGGSVTLGLLTLGPGTAKPRRRIALVAGDLVRVQCGSITVGSIALVVGESACWFAMRLVG